MDEDLYQESVRDSGRCFWGKQDTAKSADGRAGIARCVVKERLLKMDSMARWRRRDDPNPDVSFARAERVFRDVLDANNDVIGNMQMSVVPFKAEAGETDLARCWRRRWRTVTKLHVILNALGQDSYYPINRHPNPSRNKLMAKLIVYHLDH